jgi:hypothetical protein
MGSNDPQPLLTTTASHDESVNAGKQIRPLTHLPCTSWASDNSEGSRLKGQSSHGISKSMHDDASGSVELICTFGLGCIFLGITQFAVLSLPEGNSIAPC